MLKNAFFYLSTVALLSAGPAQAQAAVPAGLPMAALVAESDEFEVVGRLAEDGFVFHVDQAPSNAPVLGATLEVEAGGRKAVARFRAASGDYLIDDAAWLQPLRVPGDHALALTLLAGEASDLLAADLHVAATSTADPAVAGAGLPALAGAGGVLLAWLGWRQWRQRRGGAA